MYQNGNMCYREGLAYDTDGTLRLYHTESSWGDSDEYVSIWTHIKLNRIGEDAFYGHPLRSVTIPDSVRTIGRGAFRGCGNLQRVVLPEGLTEIGDSAFSRCEKLETILLPSSLTSIGAYAFEGCTALKQLVLPEGLKTIGDRAFACSGLEEAMLPKGLFSLGKGAFFGCRELTKAYCPPLKELPDELFSKCVNLEDCFISYGTEVLGSYMFHSCDRMVLGGSITLPPTIREMSTAFWRNDVDIFNIYAERGSYVAAEAEMSGVRHYPIRWPEGAEKPTYIDWTKE